MQWLFQLLQYNSPLLKRIRQLKDALFLPIIKLFVRFDIFPVTVTLVGFAFGLLGLWVLFYSYWGFVVLMCVSTVFDGIDGALARHDSRVTVFGAQLDYFSDTLLMIMMFIVLTIWLGQFYWLLGLGLYLIVFAAHLLRNIPVKIATNRMTVFAPAVFGFPQVGLGLLSVYAIVMGYLIWRRPQVASS